MNAHTTLTPEVAIDLSAIMRAEKIGTVHYNWHLDRFSVTLLDYSCGGGASVGEALAKAKARSAER